MKQYPTARPFIGKKEERYVMQALRSNILSMGPFQERFEIAFAKKIGTKYACAVSSGTAGLHLSLIAAGIGPGDEVITSSFSFIASANSILYVGATPIFADIDPQTYNLDPHDIEHRITKRTKAIMPVHIFGQPAAMDKIMALAHKYNLAVIEDACESFMATHRHKPAGTFGQSAVFAFYPNKQITTGEGGMIVTNDAAVNSLCRSLRNQGRAPNMKWLDHDRLGYNYRLDEMSAALGLAQVERSAILIKKRQQIASQYHKMLEPLRERVIRPETAIEATHTWFVYVIRLRNGKLNRDAIIRDLSKKGIHCKPYLPSIHLFGFYRERFGSQEGTLPESEAASTSTIALPFYIGLTQTDLVYIIKILEQVLTAHEKRHS